MKRCTPTDRHARRRIVLPLGLLLCIVVLAMPHAARTRGTGALYPPGTPGFRASIEWRTSTYGNDLLLRRTLLKVYAQANEYILLGSSAVGVDAGDIRVYNPGRVTGSIGQETIPAAPDFSCADQREQPGNTDRGRIANRDQELAGPNTEENNLVPTGYRPCVYQAPVAGIYNLVFLGPAGDGQNTENSFVRTIETVPEDFGSRQDTSVTAWDVTVRPDLNNTTARPGRLFAAYLALYTGGNGRPIYGTLNVVTQDGFIYEVTTSGADPNGFLYYSNQLGFLNTDGKPLYRDVLAVSTLPFQDQNQLVALQGGVSLQPPTNPIFFDTPDPLVLDALRIPRAPVPPSISNFAFTGPFGDDRTLIDTGGTFTFNSSSAGVYYIVISRDGVNFDPTNSQNRVLYGVLDAPGTVTVEWDGRDNADVPFPVGPTVLARTAVQGGEVHFPALDVENNRGGTTITLTNPPGGVCPPWNGECSGAFYDGRGYETANGTLVGTAVNGPLCPNNVGDPPDPLFSDPVFGFDSAATPALRVWGFSSGGNPNTFVCDPDGGFGDKKGLDLWTYYPSIVLETPLRIVEPTAITLARFTATQEPDRVVVRWETSAEINTWGFHLYRSADGTRESAVRMTPELILATGRGQGGAPYSWTDTAIQPGATYTYWLQETELSGATYEYGPVTVVAETADAPRRIALPLIRR